MVEIKPSEIRIETTNGTGPGGQKRNRTYSCVILTHIPTDLVVRCDETRSQVKNKEIALKELTKRINDLNISISSKNEIIERRNQIGNGLRSEKKRTYRVKDNIVIDHITNKQVKYNEILKGRIELLK